MAVQLNSLLCDLFNRADVPVFFEGRAKYQKRVSITAPLIISMAEVVGAGSVADSSIEGFYEYIEVDEEA